MLSNLTVLDLISKGYYEPRVFALFSIIVLVISALNLKEEFDAIQITLESIQHNV